MGWFWKVSLFALIIPRSCFNLDSNLSRNILSSIHSKEDKLSKCLIAVLREPELHSMINVRIHKEVESKYFKQNFDDTIEKFCALNDLVTVELNSDESVAYSVHIRIYFIDSLNSLKSLEVLINRQREKNRDFVAANQNYIILLSSEIPNPELILEPIFHMCWQNFIINVIVLVESANEVVTLYTYYPFNMERCSDSTPTIYNYFANGSLRWNKPTFPSKTKNFWQCPIKAILWTEAPFVILDSGKVLGFDGIILRTLATEMNFTLKVVVSPQGKGLNNPDGTSTGGFKLLQDRMGDLTIGGITIIKLRHDHFAATSSYYSTNMWVVIKTPNEYSPMEILLFPFDLYTWLGLFILYLGKWIGRVLWKWIVTTVIPFWQYSTHLRLKVWLLTILILRSSYEGSIFNFLHNSPRKIPPNNLGEALDAGFKFIVWPQSYNFFSSMKELEGRMIRVNGSKRDIFEMFARVKGNYGLLVWLDILSQYNNDSSKFEEYYIVQEPVMSVFPCIYLPKFSYLTMELNKRIAQMVTHGRINKIITNVAPIDNFMKKKPVAKKQVSLSLHRLLGAFEFLGIFAAVSTCVFIIELISVYNRRLRMVMEFLTI